MLESQYGLTGLLIACATFGLVIGGLLGSPLAKRLITRNQLAQPLTESEAAARCFPHRERRQRGGQLSNPQQRTAPDYGRRRCRNAGSVCRCLAFAEFMTGLTKGLAVQLPTFVWALGGGVVIATCWTMCSASAGL